MGKKRREEHGHHGGAWKVAYADFITAMMALFMVLWISAQDDEIKLATSEYFANPMPVFQNTQKSVAIQGGEGNSGAAEKNKVTTDAQADTAVDLAFLHSVEKEMKQVLNLDDAKTDEHRPIEIVTTDDGLKLIVYDQTERPLFESETALLTEWGNFVLQNLAWLVERYPYKIRIDGFAPPGKYGKVDYGPWELATDRANAARRALQQYAVDERKILKVSGYAGSVLAPELSNRSNANQRIEVSLVIKEEGKSS